MDNKKNVILFVSSNIILDYDKELYDNVKIVNLDLPSNDLFKEIWNEYTGYYLVPSMKIIEKGYYNKPASNKRLKHINTSSSYTPKDNILTNKNMNRILEELYSWDIASIYINIGSIVGSIITIQKFINYRDNHGINDVSQTGGKLVSY